MPVKVSKDCHRYMTELFVIKELIAEIINTNRLFQDIDNVFPNQALLSSPIGESASEYYSREREQSNKRSQCVFRMICRKKEIYLFLQLTCRQRSQMVKRA